MLSRVPGLCLGLAIVAFAGYVAHIVFGVGGPGTDTFFNQDLYSAVMLGSAIALIMCATLRVPIARPWLIGLGLLTWALGDLYYTLFFAGLKNPPFPSFDDALYLAFYPFLLRRYRPAGPCAVSRREREPLARWLDRGTRPERCRRRRGARPDPGRNRRQRRRGGDEPRLPRRATCCCSGRRERGRSDGLASRMDVGSARVSA